MDKIIRKLNDSKSVATEYVEPKLLQRLNAFAVIIFIILFIVCYNIYLGRIHFLLALFGLFFGSLVGFVAGRMFKVFWHTETQKVVSRLDKIGVFFLLLYIVIEISRKWFFGHWMHGALLNAFSLSFLAGLLLGRLLSVLNGIRMVLIKEKKF